MLAARCKLDPDPVYASAFTGKPSVVAMCGYRDAGGHFTCGGVLARIGSGTDAGGMPCWSIHLAAGYGEIAPRVTAWQLLRNAAGHGQDNFTSDQVAVMLQGVREFITRHPA